MATPQMAREESISTRVSENIYMPTYVCIYIYIYIYTYVHIYTHTSYNKMPCIHACMHTYIHTPQTHRQRRHAIALEVNFRACPKHKKYLIDACQTYQHTYAHTYIHTQEAPEQNAFV